MVLFLFLLGIISHFSIERVSSYSPSLPSPLSSSSSSSFISKPKQFFYTFPSNRILEQHNHLNTDLYASKENIIEGNSKIISNQDELDLYAKNVGVQITFSTLGPGYRAVARADHDPDQILGYCEGFVRPGGKILHVDKCEVWKKALSKAKKDNPDGFKNGGQVFGVSLLLGYTCMLFGQEKGCTVAEFLAIDDEAFQHKRLVRFFKRAGFERIRYVGEELKDVPDRLVWGGCGTLMKQDISVLLDRWSKVLM